MAARVWLITGAGRGLGLAVAQAALRAGDAVVAAARRPEAAAEALGHPERVLAARLDVTEPREAEAAVAAAVARFGRVDVLVNAAGYGQIGAFEDNSPEDVARQFDVNVFGLMHVTP